MVLAKLASGVTAVLRGLIGSRNDRLITAMLPVIEAIGALEPRFQKMTDADMHGLAEVWRKRLRGGESLEVLLPEVFAGTREAAKRTIGQRHYDVQLMSGMVLHQGKIAEASTGEGKTLSATTAAVLNAIAGRVHVITVNDYLARRDAAWMGRVFGFLGLSVGCIQAHMDNAERRKQYACDIVYGTNSEFGFDYLRDNMKTSAEQQVQGALDFAIIDEVDSILIDEARTPLIISGASGKSSDNYKIADRVARQLREGEDFQVKEKESQILLTEVGIAKAERGVGVDSFYTGANMDWPHYIEQALRAHHLFRNDKEYVVKEGEVIIVDEFTGRLQPGRRWSDGLHQAIEAKEGALVREESQTLARITYQHFFLLYKKLAGMTGTAMTEAAEFDFIYKLDVVVIPTNRPMIRISHPDVVYRTAKEKWQAVAKEIEAVHATGRPILVGTTSIETSESLSEILGRRGIAHEVLNAKYHEREAAIIAEAGQQGRVTIATNMAGRGTDILLGEGVREIGGLHILGTERHEARRIDNQLRGRAGRQGDPGSSRFIVSLGDDLMRIFASDRVSWLMEKLGMTDGVPIESPMVTRAITNAQKKVEAHNFDIRKSLLEYDEVMNVQRRTIYSMRQQVLENRDVRKTVLEWLYNRANAQIDKIMLTEEGEDSEAERARRLAELLNARYKTAIVPAELQTKQGDELRDFVESKVEESYSKHEAEIRPETMRMIEKFILLETIDTKWKDHLQEMDYLRSAVSFEGYAQRDPKEVYKIEGSSLFNQTVDAIEEHATDLVFRVRITEEDINKQKGREIEGKERHDDPSKLNPFAKQQQRAIEGSKKGGGTIRNNKEKPGRNDPCPCGSGKKYKKCCGRNE